MKRLMWVLVAIGLVACSPPEGQRVPDGGVGGTGAGPELACPEGEDCDG